MERFVTIVNYVIVKNQKPSNEQANQLSIAFGSVGRAPLLEDVSRDLLGLIGLWILWRAFRHTGHIHGAQEGAAVGFMAGLIDRDPRAILSAVFPKTEQNL
jgi:hypothetical protein